MTIDFIIAHDVETPWQVSFCVSTPNFHSDKFSKVIVIYRYTNKID